MVADGWIAFENQVGEMGMGELPQLLRSLKSSVTPTPPAPFVKQEVKMEEEMVEVAKEGEGEGEG